MSIYFRNIIKFCWRLLNAPRFKKMGKGSFIYSPLKINGAKNIIIGNRVRIQYKTWLAACSLEKSNCLLEIGDGTQIGNFNHIYATECVYNRKKCTKESFVNNIYI